MLHFKYHRWLSMTLLLFQRLRSWAITSMLHWTIKTLSKLLSSWRTARRLKRTTSSTDSFWTQSLTMSQLLCMLRNRTTKELWGCRISYLQTSSCKMESTLFGIEECQIQRQMAKHQARTCMAATHSIWHVPTTQTGLVSSTTWQLLKTTGWRTMQKTAKFSSEPLLHQELALFTSFLEMALKMWCANTTESSGIQCWHQRGLLAGTNQSMATETLSPSSAQSRSTSTSTSR